MWLFGFRHFEVTKVVLKQLDYKNHCSGYMIVCLCKVVNIIIVFQKSEKKITKCAFYVGETTNLTGERVVINL